MENELWDIEDVAKYLGVTTRTVYRYLTGGKEDVRLNGVRLAGFWRFEESDVVDFVSRLREKTQADLKSRPKKDKSE